MTYGSETRPLLVQWTYNDIHNNHSRYTLYKQKYHTNNIYTIRINLQKTSDKDVSRLFF